MDLLNNDNIIYWAKTRPDALIPQRLDENAGYDFYATFDEEYIFIGPYKTGLVPTGISWATSDDYYLKIEERSSTGTKGIKTSSGIIDSGYRGEIKVVIFNANDKPLVISPYSIEEVRTKLSEEMNRDVEFNDFIFYSTSKAIAQGIVHRVEKLKTKEISLQALKQIPSFRGDNAWGSTNKN